MADPIQFGNYAPDQYVVNFGGRDLQGFADGTFIKAVMNEQTFKVKAGVRIVTRVRTTNFTGVVTMTFAAISDSNDVLQAFADADRESGRGAAPLFIKDLNGNTAATAAHAWIRKVPDLERGDDGPNTEWEFECAELIIHHGGSLT